MKREYVTPTAVVDRFTTEDFCVTCNNETKTYYQFQCNAPAGFTGNVWKETNGNPGLQIISFNPDTEITGLRTYHACGEPHTVEVVKGTPASDVFDIGYIVDGLTYRTIYIWDEDGTNVHCMESPNTTDIVIPVVKS